MVIQKAKVPFFKVKKIWLSEKVRYDFIHIYIRSKFNGKLFGYRKSSFFTKLINLQQDIKLIEEAISKTNKYEIRRAEREGVLFEMENDRSTILSFYNKFAETNNSLTPYTEYVINSFGENLIVTKAVLNNQIFAMHGYITDREIGRVILLFSATLPRTQADKDKNASIGRANKFLHYRDIVFFKKDHFKCYDLGGYVKETTDKALLGINKFKDSFGGILVEEFDYTPFWIVGLRKIRTILNNF